MFRSRSTEFSTLFLMFSGLLCTIALLVSGYLAYVGLTSSSVVGCDGGLFNCDHVLTSRWSKLLGIPVSIPAVGLYAVMIAAIAQLRSDSATVRKIAASVLTAGALAAATAAAWFVSLQVFSIRHFCPYCLVVHACGLGLTSLVLWKRPPALLKTPVSAGVGIVSAGVLIAIQAASPAPKTFSIQSHEVEPQEVQAEVFDPLASSQPSADQTLVATSNSVQPNYVNINRHDVDRTATDVDLCSVVAADSGVSWLLANPLFAVMGVVAADDQTQGDGGVAADAKADAAPRLVPVSGGRKQLNVQQWPVWGNADGKYLIVEMFDYTCSHCRSMHRTLKAASEQLGGQLGVLTLPVPLHRACNDAATSSSPERADACEIAKLAITVWLVDRTKFTQYHDWLFQQQRTAGQARQYAESLVGADALRTEYSKDIASKYISKNVMLYKEAGRGTVPKVVFPTTTLTGEIGSASTIVDFAKKGVDG